jgi:hypothetical protein
MKRLLIAATLALGALAGSQMQAQADGGFGIGIGLKLNFSYGCAKSSGACPPTYGCGMPVAYPCPSMPPYQGGGYPMPGTGGFDPAMAGMSPFGGMGMPPMTAMAPQGYGGYPSMGGQQAFGNSNGYGGMNGMAYGQPALGNGGYGGYQMPTATPAVYAAAE